MNALCELSCAITPVWLANEIATCDHHAHVTPPFWLTPLSKVGFPRPLTLLSSSLALASKALTSFHWYFAWSFFGLSQFLLEEQTLLFQAYCWFRPDISEQIFKVMKAVIQRVISASVTGEGIFYVSRSLPVLILCYVSSVDNEVISQISKGLVVLVGIRLGQRYTSSFWNLTLIPQRRRHWCWCGSIV